MMGEKDPQLELYYKLSLESFVPEDHPLRSVRHLVDDEAIRSHCRKLYSPIGRPVSWIPIFPPWWTLIFPPSAGHNPGRARWNNPRDRQC